MALHGAAAVAYMLTCIIARHKATVKRGVFSRFLACDGNDHHAPDDDADAKQIVNVSYKHTPQLKELIL